MAAMDKRMGMTVAWLAAASIGTASIGTASSGTASSGTAAVAPGGNAMMQTIEVASHDGKVLVTMQFENRGAQTVYVPKAVAKDGELFGKHFGIKVAGSGQELDYIGPMVKRAPFGPTDYLPVKANSEHRSVLDISRAYDFLPGQHTYQLRYVGNYVADPKQAATAAPVPMPVVTFTHTRK